jgi:hypothetical protein
MSGDVAFLMTNLIEILVYSPPPESSTQFIDQNLTL